MLENRVAALIRSCEDFPGNAKAMFAPDQIDSIFTALDAARFRIHVHVIGDRAARAALDGLATAQKATGAWPALHQLAQLQIIDRTDIPLITLLESIWGDGFLSPGSAEVAHLVQDHDFREKSVLDIALIRAQKPG